MRENKPWRSDDHENARKADRCRYKLSLLPFSICTMFGTLELLNHSPDAHWFFLAAVAAPVAYLLGQSYVDGKREEARTIDWKISPAKGGD